MGGMFDEPQVIGCPPLRIGGPTHVDGRTRYQQFTQPSGIGAVGGNDGAARCQARFEGTGLGGGFERILAWVAEFRATDATTPIVLMGYLNPIEIYGYARFAEQAHAAGVDGVLIVDVPVEESGSVERLRDAGIRQIFLVAPTTTELRLAAIRERAQGFVYYVSFAGITGATQLGPVEVRRRVDHIKQGGDIPVAVGFGVRDAATAVTVSASADAVVIGSALVARLAEAEDAESAVSVARDFLAPIREALDLAAAA